MTRIRRSLALLCLACACILAMWTGLGLALHGLVVRQNNVAALTAETESLLRRVEKAVDFAVIASTDLVISGRSGCDDETQSYLRRMALGIANVPNIFLITDGRVCTSFEDFEVVLPTEAERAGWVTARNSYYRLGPMAGTGGTFLGVSRGFGASIEQVVAVDLSALMFDVLTYDLRDHGRVYLWTDYTQIEEFIGDGTADADVATWQMFSDTSERYPLSVELQIDPDALAQWRSDVPTPVALLWSATGILVAFGFGFVMRRGQDKSLEAVLLALDRGEIVPYFQPIVHLQSGDTIGCEALARWVKPGGEVVPPSAFIPLIEEHRLNGRLLEALLRKTAAHFEDVLAARPTFYVGFNITPDQLEETTFPGKLISLVARSGLRPEQICLEITERHPLIDANATAQVVDEIAAAGFRIAIDDAGTGHNGLSAIQALKAGTLKIDKFFIDQIDDGSRARAMVDLFVGIARRYEMKTVAEGVETAGQLASLRLAGVDAVQGFYYSKPLPAYAFVAALETRWSDSVSVTAA